MNRVTPKKFTADEHDTWRLIVSEHERKRDSQICDIFLKGIDVLGIDQKKIPELEQVNETLKNKTRFTGVLVEGLEDGSSFFKLLADRKFPIGNFIRDKKDLSYTPAPDVVHDLYGHLPFFTDQAYADFWQRFGEAACAFKGKPELLREFERFYWFTAEFSLVKTQNGVRVFGAGIASSTGECEFALSAVPEVLPFNVDRIRKQEFRIDEMQRRLFCIESSQQLYNSLPELLVKVGT